MFFLDEEKIVRFSAKALVMILSKVEFVQFDQYSMTDSEKMLDYCYRKFHIISGPYNMIEPFGPGLDQDHDKV